MKSFLLSALPSPMKKRKKCRNYLNLALKAKQEGKFPHDYIKNW
jgi:hypothetical protein